VTVQQLKQFEVYPAWR